MPGQFVPIVARTKYLCTLGIMKVKVGFVRTMMSTACVGVYMQGQVRALKKSSCFSL